MDRAIIGLTIIGFVLFIPGAAVGHPWMEISLGVFGLDALTMIYASAPPEFHVWVQGAWRRVIAFGRPAP